MRFGGNSVTRNLNICQCSQEYGHLVDSHLIHLTGRKGVVFQAAWRLTFSFELDLLFILRANGFYVVGTSWYKKIQINPSPFPFHTFRKLRDIWKTVCFYYQLIEPVRVGASAQFVQRRASHLQCLLFCIWGPGGEEWVPLFAVELV